MIALDARVLIAFLFRQDPHHDAAAELLHAVAIGPLLISQVTMAEVLVLPTRLGHLATTRQVLDDLQVNEISLPDDAATRLARLRVDTGMRLPDCCVLLAAQDAGAAIATFNRRLTAAAQQLGLRTYGEAGGS